MPVIFLTSREPDEEFFARLATIMPVDFLPARAVGPLLGAKVQQWRQPRVAAKNDAKNNATRADERAALQVAERFQVLLDASPDYGIFYLNPQGTIREWTANAEHLFGYSATEAVGANFDLVFREEDRAAGVPAAELACASRDNRARAERWLRRKDGSRFFAVSRLVAVRERDELRGFVEILRDATARKEAETRLREALDHFQNLADNISQLAWMGDPAGHRFWFNRRWLEYTGTTVEQMRGWNWCRMVHPDHVAAAKRTVNEALAREEPFAHTLPLRAHDGSYRWFLCQGAPVKDVSGQVIRWVGTSTDINDDVVLRQKLGASEEKFRGIFETANEGIWVIDDAGRVEIANSRMGELLGYTAEELVGQTKTDFVFEADKARVSRQLTQRRLRSAMSVEVRFRHRSGRDVWTLMSSRPVMREREFAGALEMFTDVTARKVIEQALRSSEAQFRGFFDSAAAGHAFVDPHAQHFLRVNPRLVEMTGYAAAELERMTPLDLVQPEDRREEEVSRRRLYRGEVHELSGEKRYRRKGGATIWVQVTTTLLRDAAGVAWRELCVMQDISDRMAAELELAQRSTQLQLAVEVAELGTFFNDEETGDHVWNEQNKRLLGLPPDAKPSMEAFLERVHPDDRNRVARKLRTVARARPPGREFTIQYRVIWPDGSIHHIAARGRALRERRGNGRIATKLIGTARDVSAVKRFERELQRKVAERTAALQERTDQLEAFSYTVAHDLRSPIRAINGYAEILQREFAGGGKVPAVEYVQKIQRSAERMDALICDLLAFSQIVQMRVVTGAVSLEEVVHNVVAELHPLIASHAAMIEIQSPLPVVRAERSVLEQIIRNLLTNALKFVAPGVPPRVTIAARETVETVTVRVTDNGIGIPAAYHDRIFRVFERLETSADYPGTGVGLAIVAKAVERLDGRVGLESEPAQGSTFWFELKKPEA